MPDLRDRLAHVLWLGGVPCAGKTTLSHVLAERYGLEIYDTDWHRSHVHGARPGGTIDGWAAMTMDERWLVPTPAAMAERDIRNWTRLFPLVLEDLLALPARPIVAEGPSLFPWCVAPLLRSPRQALFLLPTAALRDEAVRRRGRTRMEWKTSDPERALHNVAARDALLAEAIASSCRELGLATLAVGGDVDVDAAFAAAAAHFAPHLARSPNV